MTYPRCSSCDDILPLPDMDGAKNCVHGCSRRLRRALTNADFKKEDGEVRDCPQLPAVLLLDDIHKQIIKLETAAEYYSYSFCNYPPSHHME